MKQDLTKPLEQEGGKTEAIDKIQSKFDAIDLIVDEQDQGAEVVESCGEVVEETGDLEKKLIEELCNKQTRCIICLEDWPITATLGKNIEVEVEVEEE